MIDLRQIRGIDTLRNVFFGECHTASDVADKVVTAPGYTLDPTKLLAVKFTNGIDADLNNTLNVNGLGVIPIESHEYMHMSISGSHTIFNLLEEAGTPLYALLAYHVEPNIGAFFKVIATNGLIGVLDQIFNIMDGHSMRIADLLTDKQDTLESGTNIKTVNGKSLLGSGNVQLGKGWAVVNSTAAADNYGAVTCELICSGMDLTEAGGILVLAYFNHNVPANGRLTITDGGSATVCLLSDISYPDSLSHNLASGDISAGDVCLLHYFYNGGTNITFLLANLSRVQSLRTINGNTLYGTGDIAVLPPHTPHTTTIPSAGSTTTIACAADERAFHFVQVGKKVGCTLRINILNGWDNTVLVSGTQTVRIDILHNGSQVATCYEGNGFFDGIRANLGKCPVMKLVIEIVEGKAVVDVDEMYEYDPSV